MNKPLITIIFQVENEAFFEVSIRSILRQQFFNFQCIIAATAGGDRLLSALGIDDPRIVCSPASFFEDESGAFNKTLVKVQSKYICFLNTDDQLHSNYLERMSNYMERNPKWGCGHCGVELADKNWNLLDRKTPHTWQKTKVSLFKNNEIVLSSLMFRTSLLKKNNLTYQSILGRGSEYSFLVYISSIAAIKPINEMLFKHIEGLKNDKMADELKLKEDDQVRLSQLRSLNIRANKAQSAFHLKLMKNEVLNEGELEEALNWFNQLLEFNKKLKIYHSGFLYKLFEDVLLMETRRSLITSSASPGINRTSLINLYIKNFNYRSYLEIGVFKPEQNFDHVSCKTKIGVDPQPLRPDIVGLTSDQYFEQLTENEKFDIIFIDGLHHYEQVIKDITMGLRHLNENGTIICHDMLPSTEIMQEVPRRTLEWTGDCWKAWSHFRMSRSDLEMSVVNADYGLGIIRRGNQECYKPVMNVLELDYEFFLVNKKQLLNIIEPNTVFSHWI